MRRMIACVAMLGSMAGAAAAPPPRLAGAPAAPFYAWQGEAPAPGALLRHEPLGAELSLANAGRSERILYGSTDGVDGKTAIAVSGALFWPKGEPPAGGWPLVAWAHGTVGATASCAPSSAGRSQRDIEYLNAWLAAGFAVAASDFQGLGTAGGHPYLATRPEAYGVLDAVRAAQSQPGIGKKVVIVGQSQGAGAAFATAAFQPQYAPQVNVLGTVATGVPYFSPQTLAALARAGLSEHVTPTLAYSFLLLQLAELTQPGFDPSPYLTSEGRKIYDMGATACLGPMEDAIVQDKVSAKAGFAKTLEGVAPTILPLIAYPTLHLDQPLFVGTGEVDEDVPPAMQGALVHDACAAGTKVEWKRYPGLDHSATVNASLKDSLPFVKDLLAGRAPPSDCP